MKLTAENSRMGFVLAGGRSSRMGTDKAFLTVDGQTLLERALRAMRSVCPVTVIVGAPNKFEHLGAVISDRYSGCGPLAGIHAALSHSSTELNLVMAVDLPFVVPALLRFLLTRAESSSAIVTVPRIAAGLQPLCAVYRREFAELAEHALQAGKYKIDALFADTSVCFIESPELLASRFSDRMFANVNTPEDLEHARREF